MKRLTKKDMREAAIARDLQKCRRCGAPDGAFIARHRFDDGFDILANAYERDVARSQRQRITEVTLSVIHEDHNLKNFELDNLLAACLHCRRVFHAKDFARQRAIAKRRKMLAAGFVELFPQEETPDGYLRLRPEVPVLECTPTA